MFCAVSTFGFQCQTSQNYRDGKTSERRFSVFEFDDRHEHDVPRLGRTQDLNPPVKVSPLTRWDDVV
jgi:hypothetical protein